MARATRLAFLALTVGFIVLVPGEAHACSCAPALPVCESYSRTSAVFTAEVLEIRDEPSESSRPGQLPARRRVTLRVEQMLRGAPTRQLEVLTGSGGGDCGYPFKKGDKYLVFASGVEGQLTVSVCSRTKPLGSAVAAEEVRKITESCGSQPSQLVLRGSVVRPNSRAARDVKVALYSADTSTNGEIISSVMTNRRGEFSIVAPAGRRYLVMATTATERAEVGSFELTPATAPILLVLRK